MEPQELSDLIDDLRDEGSDLADVEVKRAREAFPTSIAPTLSAFGNTPGGGILILGLDERSGFSSTGVYDVAACKQALGNAARTAVDPALRIELESHEFEGAPLVVARVHELDASHKPCRVTASKKAYLRSYDGDHALSELEVQAFIANRSRPQFDEEPVESATMHDLDPDLIQAYLRTCRANPGPLAAMSDDQILQKTGVVDRRGVPSTAGILAMGTYPQEFFPNFVIQASVLARDSDPTGTRAVDPRKLEGPIPMMLDEAVGWVERNTSRRVIFGADGHGRDVPQFPREAIRELVANALVHRDLAGYAMSIPVTMRLEPTRLVLSNQGGLFGITTARLGSMDPNHVHRNSRLVRICQNVRMKDGRTVIEALATGIPTVIRSLKEAGMTPPKFLDQGIRFTVLLPSHTLLSADDLHWLSTLPAEAQLSDIQRFVLASMHRGEEWSNRALRDVYPMDSRDARLALTGLVDQGWAVAVGEKRNRVYRIAPESGVDDVDESSISAAEGAGASSRDQLLRLIKLGPKSKAELVAAMGLTVRQVDYALRVLRDSGAVELRGGRGHRDSAYYPTGQD